uniref:Uncharacterized protein n=1 Tax=Oryza nivara TaxID=4536 RepID=A0A0E0HXI4_ORYNI
MTREEESEKEMKRQRGFGSANLTSQDGIFQHAHNQKRPLFQRDHAAIPPPCPSGNVRLPEAPLPPSLRIALTLSLCRRKRYCTMNITLLRGSETRTEKSEGGGESHRLTEFKGMNPRTRLPKETKQQGRSRSTGYCGIAATTASLSLF